MHKQSNSFHFCSLELNNRTLLDNFGTNSKSKLTGRNCITSDSQTSVNLLVSNYVELRYVNIWIYIYKYMFIYIHIKTIWKLDMQLSEHEEMEIGDKENSPEETALLPVHRKL